MSLSKTSLETLLDLVEIKLSCMEVWDREDRRELQSLDLARRELLELAARAGGRGAPSGRLRGRPPLRRPVTVELGACWPAPPPLRRALGLVNYSLPGTFLKERCLFRRLY